jgi:hypothetical protein
VNTEVARFLKASHSRSEPHALVSEAAYTEPLKECGKDLVKPSTAKLYNVLVQAEINCSSLGPSRISELNTLTASNQACRPQSASRAGPDCTDSSKVWRTNTRS